MALVFTNGNPAADVSVRVRSKSYLQPSPNPYLGKGSAGAFTLDGETDANGVYRINSIPPGSYVLEANDGSFGIVSRIEIVENENQKYSDTLRLVGSVSGSVLVSGEITGQAYIQVSGLERLIAINPIDGSFFIKNLPAGEYSLPTSLAPGDTGLHGPINITVKSGETTTVLPIIIDQAYPN